MNEHGDICTDSLKASEISNWVKSVLPQEELTDLAVSYSSLNEQGKCHERTTPLSSLILREKIIIYEISSISKNFKFLTPPRFIQP